MSFKKFTPKPHQFEALNDILNHKNGLLKNDRVQYVSACGTGKTPVLLWSVEQYYQAIGNGEIKDTITVFLFPSLTLINQSYDTYASQNSIEGYNPLVVCSDDKVGQKENEEDTVENCPFAVSTNQLDIEAYLKQDTLSNKVIFSTYKSSHLVGEALKSVGKVADITVYDEAHRTAIKNENSQRVDTVLHNSGWSLDNENFPSKKRLFATATPRHYNLSDNFYEMGLIDKGSVAYSMDNPMLFGQIAHELSMRKAIELGLITDYKILAIAVTKEDVLEFLNPKTNDKNYKTYDQGVLESVAKILAVQNAAIKYDLKSAVVFNSNIEDSKEFVRNFTGLTSIEANIAHIDGSFNNYERQKTISVLEKEGFSILSNSKLLSEGHDMPEADFVVFNNKIESKTDIVQRVGRVQRLDSANPNKMGYILLPIFVDNLSASVEESFKNNNGLQTLFNTVNSLKESDTQLRDWISTRKKIREERRNNGENVDLNDSNNKIIFTDLIALKKEQNALKNEAQKVALENEKAYLKEEYAASVEEVDEKYKSLLEHWEDKIEATIVGENFEREEAWNFKFDLTKEFVELNGFDELKKSTNHKGVPIGSWLNTQKTALKKGTLSQDRVDRLLGVHEDIFKSVEEINAEMWDYKFDLTKEFVELNGFDELKSSTNHKGVPIGGWLSSQKTALKAGTLSQDKVDRLLGVHEDIFKSRSEIDEEAWNFKLDLTKEFVELNGFDELKFATNHKGVAIGVWLGDQKQALKKGTLSQDKVDRLLGVHEDILSFRNKVDLMDEAKEYIKETGLDLETIQNEIYDDEKLDVKRELFK